MSGLLLPSQDAADRRRRRALDLAETHAHAAEALHLYAAITEAQAPIRAYAASAPGPEVPLPPSGTDAPFLRLERFAASDLVEPWLELVQRIARRATPVLAAAASSLGARPGDQLTEVLRAALEGRTQADATEAFFGRVLIAALAEGAAVGLHARASGPEEPAPPPHEEGLGQEAVMPMACVLACPACGALPQIAVLADRPAAKGARHLVCSRCTTAWSFPRSTCAACGSINADALLIHTMEGAPGLRVHECQDCASYLKEVDLRQDGRAVALVEDLATPELDVWAAERGWKRPVQNLLGY